MLFIKISHTEFSNGGSLLSTKDFLKHDMLHRLVDRALGIEKTELHEHTMEIEMITGMLHHVFDDEFDTQRVLEAAENMFGSKGEKVPFYFTKEFIETIRTQARDAFIKYRDTKTGGSIEI